MTTSNRLGATVGGKLLESEQARALWERFSAYMDVHRNDFAGFAKSEGWAHASVGPYGTGAMLTLGNDANSILNRSVVIHADPDDYKSQPAGNSGKRVACGVIRAAGSAY